MKKITKTLLSLLLCLTVAMGMMLFVPQEAYAAMKPVTGGIVYNGSTITAVNYNKSSSVKVYTSQTPSSYTSYEYNVKMPEKGTLMVQYSTSGGPSYYAKGCGASYAGETNHSSGDKIKAWNVSAAGNVKLTVYVEKNTSAAFAAYYVPASAKLPANISSFILGRPAYNVNSVVRLTAPDKGYFEVYATNGFDGGSSSAQVNTAGFKGWEYVNKYSGYRSCIGVTKGKTYNINLKGGSAAYNIKVVFHKVKETSNKTSKKKAAKMKRKKVNHGIIPTGYTKAHWYKIKQTKNRKMKLTINTSKLGSGGSYSGKLKVTMYFPKGKKQYGYVYPGKVTTFNVISGRIGTKKAQKGTYRVKIEPVNGANGYFTVKWK